MIRLPEGEDWRDHAMPCENCDKPVLAAQEHYVNATATDPGWWRCDTKGEG